MINGWEWIVILAVVLLVFGVGRISKLGEEMGKGIKAFRQGVREGQENEDSADGSADNDAVSSTNSDANSAGKS